MISMDKKYRTRSGYEVRILSTDRKDNIHPVVALVMYTGKEYLRSYKPTGKVTQDRESAFDLIEIKTVKYLKPLHQILNENPNYVISSSGGLIIPNVTRIDSHVFKYLGHPLPFDYKLNNIFIEEKEV